METHRKKKPLAPYKLLLDRIYFSCIYSYMANGSMHAYLSVDPKLRPVVHGDDFKWDWHNVTFNTLYCTYIQKIRITEHYRINTKGLLVDFYVSWKPSSGQQSQIMTPYTVQHQNAKRPDRCEQRFTFYFRRNAKPTRASAIINFLSYKNKTFLFAGVARGGS